MKTKHSFNEASLSILEMQTKSEAQLGLLLGTPLE